MGTRVILVVIFAAAAALLVQRGAFNRERLGSGDGGGPRIVQDVQRDAIPPLDNPKYETASEAENWLGPDDPVLGVEFNGDARAYPLKVMNWHEIVNETIGGEDVVVTYCPLCRSGIVFDRSFEGQLLSFGNTGALYESAMVMYDRETETYWYQAGALGIKGPHEGKKLTILPSRMTLWREWKADNPGTKVLSIDTGFGRNYLSDPYTGHDRPDSSPAFPVSRIDDRLPNKILIVGIVVDGKAKAYPVRELRGQTVTDEFNGQKIEVVGDESGQGAQILFVDEQGGRTPAPVTAEFWFSWAVSHPDTEIYKSD